MTATIRLHVPSPWTFATVMAKLRARGCTCCDAPRDGHIAPGIESQCYGTIGPRPFETLGHKCLGCGRSVIEYTVGYPPR